MPEGTSASRVSSTMTGSPNDPGVAAASTYSQRGVITAVPKEWSLGLIRKTAIRKRPFQDGRTLQLTLACPCGSRTSHTKRESYDDKGSLELLERSRRDHVWQRAKTIPNYRLCVRNMAQYGVCSPD